MNRFAMAIVLVWSTAACFGAEGIESRTLTVNGSGTASTAPDMAVVTLGVESFEKTAVAAMADNSRRTQELIAALMTSGIAEKDLQTRSINLNASYDHRRATSGRPAERILLGYNASNIVTARVRDMDRVGEAIDAAIKAGGNRVDGIGFEISDPTSVLAAAREAAWENAYSKASQLAKLAGVNLGEVIKIESYERTPGPVREVAMMRSADAAPVAPGEQQLSVQINIVWAIH